MKSSTAIIMIASLAVLFTCGIAIVDREWTMDAFYPLIGGGFFCIVIVVGNWISKAIKGRRGK